MDFEKQIAGVVTDILADYRQGRDIDQMEIFRHPDKLRRAGLDVPQSSALAEELEKLGVKLTGDCYTPALCADQICRYIEENKLR